MIANPVSRIPVFYTISPLVHSEMGVPAEHKISTHMNSVLERTLGDRDVQPLPMRVKFVQKSGEPFLQEIDVLHPQVNWCEDATEERYTLRPKLIVLVPMNGTALFAPPFPRVLLVHADSDKVFHDFRDSGVMVPFDPHDLDSTLRVRELADIRDKTPMVFGEPGEV